MSRILYRPYNELTTGIASLAEIVPGGARAQIKDNLSDLRELCGEFGEGAAYASN
jgi:hypothetical protein